MPQDIDNLQAFYNTELGRLCRRFIGRVIRSRWGAETGGTVASLGYGVPYLHTCIGKAGACMALMPAEQGAVVWPESGRCATALVDLDMLPLPDASIDRLLLAHVLEAAPRPETLLEEVWRVLAPEGRVLIVAPSRRGVWAHAEGTPYGHGLPYSRAQLRDILQRASFTPVFWGEALYMPPVSRRLVIRAAPSIERLGSALGLPFAGVHVVDAKKQVQQPALIRVTKTSRLTQLRPALAVEANR